jgi:hypothetical protein
MLDILKPPTDNLYKFLAITGLLLFTISIVLPCYALVTLEIKRLEAVKELNVTKAESEEAEILEKLVEAARLTVEAARKETEAAFIKEKELQIKKRLRVVTTKDYDEVIQALEKASNNLSEAQKDYTAKSDQYHKQVTLVRKRVIDNEYQTEVLGVINEGVFLNKLVLFLGAIIGGFIAVAGFILWYRKVQVYEDAALKDGASKEKESSEDITESQSGEEAKQIKDNETDGANVA